MFSGVKQSKYFPFIILAAYAAYWPPENEKSDKGVRDFLTTGEFKRSRGRPTGNKD